MARSITLVVIVCALAAGTIYALDRLWEVHPVLLFLIGFVAYFYAIVMIAPHVGSWLTRRRPPSHERVRIVRTWDSPLDPEGALQSISAALQHVGTVVHAEGNRRELALGSDVVFRRWGFYLEPGRRALPVRLVVEATPQGTGSWITAEARDDLGWYWWALQEFDRKKVAEAITELLDQAEAATDQATR